MSTAVKLGIAACIVASVTAYMAYVGSQTSWQYFLTVEECLADAPALVNQRVRVSGKVVVDSLEIAAGRTGATFKIGEADSELSVSCSGPLPDNLAEGKDVVVEGRLDELGHLRGDKVLTRCASKYASEARMASAVRPQASTERARR